MIDSLDTGGAEKMAVNYANGISRRMDFSALVATRREGPLKEQLLPEVHYLFLDKKSTFDPAAVGRLRQFCKGHGITHIHAHSTSFFTAFLLKAVLFSVKIIWHDHYGLSEFASSRKPVVLPLVSHFFEGIIAVNYKLKDWAAKELYCKNVVYLPNFTTLDHTAKGETVLKGTPGRQVLCLANLRFQKNHFLLLEIAEKIKERRPDWSFHLVGKDFEDEYSERLRNEIMGKGLQRQVFLYGSRNDTQQIISQAAITVLTSRSEGLPVALLEYGLNSKALVATDVGEIPLIIKNGENGFLVPNYDAGKFCEALIRLMDDPDLRMRLGRNLHTTIMDNNSEAAVVASYLDWLKKANGK